jgi:hypothetical protein
MLIQLFYVSERPIGTTDLDVRTILSSSEVGNRRRDITGMLAQSTGHFAQVLEGRDDAIDTLMARIQADARHRSVHVAFRRTVERRAFDRWAMGFVHCDDVADAVATFHAASTTEPAASQPLYELLFLRRTEQDALAEGYARRPSR